VWGYCEGIGLLVEVTDRCGVDLSSLVTRTAIKYLVSSPKQARVALCCLYAVQLPLFAHCW
jgi:hypothetical protein